MRGARACRSRVTSLTHEAVLLYRWANAVQSGHEHLPIRNKTKAPRVSSTGWRAHTGAGVQVHKSTRDILRT